MPRANILDGSSEYRVISEMYENRLNMMSSRNMAFPQSIWAEFEKLFPFINTGDI